jgi:hypothetical protein
MCNASDGNAESNWGRRERSPMHPLMGGFDERQLLVPGITINSQG